MAIETTSFDAAEFLERDSSKLFLLNDALGSNNPRYAVDAIGAVIRSSGGMSWLERKTGVKRQILHKSFGEDGNPTVKTLFLVLQALSLKLQVVAFTDGQVGTRELAEA